MRTRRNADTAFLAGAIKASVLVPMALALALALTLGAASPVVRHLTLHAATPIDEKVAGCTPDPLQFAANSSIKAIASLLGLGNETIEFKGCTSGEFQTYSLQRRDGSLSYIIYYRLNPQAAPADYIGPLAHELGHVYQIKQVGDFGLLNDKYCVLKLELGADFIAGYAYRNALKSNALPEFENNLTLFGDFDAQNPSFHGRPDERVASFRNGYFLYRWSTLAQLVTAYDRFQTFDLPSMLLKNGGANSACNV